MLRTPLCDLLGIDVPVVCASFGPWDQVELSAAVSRAGGLGSLGATVRPVEQLRAQWARMRELTDRPFAINHTGRPFREEAFAASLEARPPVISFHMGVVPELVARAHEAGARWMQLVTDRRQAEAALDAGADVLVAQGGEAGGHAGWVSTIVLVPQVVDAAGDVPVVAAGGIADGRGLAAALVLGAQGVLMGTRFLASEELRIADAWKRRIVEADAVDAVKVVNHERVLPPFTFPGGEAEPRSLRTPLVDALRDDPASVDGREVGRALVAALAHNGGEDLLPFAVQSAALIYDVRPAATIVAAVVAEAEGVLGRAAATARG